MSRAPWRWLSRCCLCNKVSAIHVTGTVRCCPERLTLHPACAPVCPAHAAAPSCPPGYTYGNDGVTCVATDCTGTAPCENGGVCVGTAPSAVCDCTGTFHAGPTCSNDVRECDVDNGGCAHVCVERVGAAQTCECLPGYASINGGTTCVADDCTGSSPCKNGGRCTGTAPNAVCDCGGTGYVGATCEEDIRQCSINNGGCAHFCDEQAAPAPPVCRCIHGYTTTDGGVTCVAPSCSGDFPHEINGKWCVKYDETREDGTSATNACRASGGALLTVSSRAVAQQAMAITVRASAWVVLTMAKPFSVAR